MKNEVIKLITIEETLDADGFPIQTEKEFECLAELSSVRYSEYYQATALGINATLMVSINQIDYDCAGKPTQVLFDGTKYKIIRSFRVKKHNSIELTLAEVENG